MVPRECKAAKYGYSIANRSTIKYKKRLHNDYNSNANYTKALLMIPVVGWFEVIRTN